MILIGSGAMWRRFPAVLGRPPQDNDYIATYDRFREWRKGRNLDMLMPKDQGNKLIVRERGLISEFELAWSDSTASELMDLVAADPRTLAMSGVGVPHEDVLYALKMSHRFLRNSPYFLKTMADIKAMRKLGCTINPIYADWFKRREKATYNYSHPKLNQAKDAFFDPNQGIKYIYDHDGIHRAMARPGFEPAYTYFKADQAEVMCSREAFENCDYETRLASVVEESYVLALERSQVPFPGKLTPKASFQIALEKVCTSISSGWWRDFAWENYEQAMAVYDDTYVVRFWAAVRSGAIKTL